MSEQIATGWTSVPLEDIAELVRGVTFPTTDKRHQPGDGLVACLRTTNVQAAVEWTDLWFIPERHIKHPEQLVRVDDVLISTANSYELVGKVARVTTLPTRSTLGAFISALRARSGVKPKFLYYQLATAQIQQAIRDMSSTTTNISNVSGAKLKQLPLKVAPTAEQARIVEKLEELLSDLDAGVAELKAAQAKLQQYRQSLLKAAVEGALTQAWRESNPAPEETGADLLARILRERRARWEARQLAKFEAQGNTPPKGWQRKYSEPVAPAVGVSSLPITWTWATLDQLTEFITSGSRGWADYYSDSGATFIRSQDINRDQLDLTDCAHVQAPRGSEGQRTRVELDDLLLTITGANVGKAARVHIDLEEAYVSQHVALLRPVQRWTSQYLHLFLTATGGARGQLNKAAYGAGKPGLNLDQVGGVLVPLPPSAEAAALVASVTGAFAAVAIQEAAISASLRQSTAQRQNLLRAAFAGQLVPQDPADEPAAELLARIRAERAQQAPVKRRGRRTETA
ncbi:restriction endonuclease subunit S [uncultured Pseudacidovorax sp.]|uniref:restriction endonuclease subunit S n=1 Tax=uncultured Pseudacidovorax sp. TaxID=679313 RepID=UPI0025E4F8DF|nr:restriction endonuclease subunit S [uncultured Pseudacidovorax sp.]